MKIGIITHYYKSENYGGNLQAYALCKYINQYLGYDAEQISYDRKSSRSIKIFLWRLLRSMKNYRSLSIARQLNQRRRAILRFNQENIRHSVPYNDADLKKTNEIYDVFITGSDQVWHPNAVCPAYLLDFVEKGKKKLSYAASVAVNTLSEEICGRYKNSLQDYMAISVRESNTVGLIQNLTNQKVECVLDPTFLLSRADWDQICKAPELSEPYVFCFFLGDDNRHRNLAGTYAKKHGLKVVTLPYLLGAYRDCDHHFGDIQLYDVSPDQFIGLVKQAECVFTDSFHASVFSIIYHRLFYVFERPSKKSMGSRLYTLTDLFDMQDRFCDTEEKHTIEYIESLPVPNYDRSFEKFAAAKKHSEAFLKRNLESIKNES